MTNKDKKFFIPVSGQWVEVSEEIYYEYYRPIWRTHEYAQRHGQCRCRKSDIWKCDGVCQGCEFYTAGNQISFDGTVDEEEVDDIMLENAIADEVSPLEEIITDMELLDALYEELERLEPERRQMRGVIAAVSDPNERLVLRYRYVHCMTWREIGNAMNADSRTIRRWHSNALLHVVVPEDTVII